MPASTIRATAPSPEPDAIPRTRRSRAGRAWGRETMPRLESRLQRARDARERPITTPAGRAHAVDTITPLHHRVNVSAADKTSSPQSATPQLREQQPQMPRAQRRGGATAAIASPAPTFRATACPKANRGPRRMTGPTAGTAARAAAPPGGPGGRRAVASRARGRAAAPRRRKSSTHDDGPARRRCSRPAGTSRPPARPPKELVPRKHDHQNHHRGDRERHRCTFPLVEGEPHYRTRWPEGGSPDCRGGTLVHHEGRTRAARHRPDPVPHEARCAAAGNLELPERVRPGATRDLHASRSALRQRLERVVEGRHAHALTHACAVKI